jgi:predicted metal-dependent hydrolase
MTLFDSCKNKSSGDSNQDLLPELEEQLSKLIGGKFKLNPIRVSISFYPYSRLNHTIRLRINQVTVRLSDILEDAPRDVISAIVDLLGHKILRKNPPRKSLSIYRSYTLSKEVQEKIQSVRRDRGKKRFLPPHGDNFDLTSLFKKLNQDYFQGKILIEKIGWSIREARKTLGHYDPAHQTIVINQRLDNPLVPEYVVNYVLYHEMLHVFFGSITSNGQRIVHHSDFRKREKQFKDYKRAKAFISENF